MASATSLETKNMGFVLVRVRLGTKQEFSVSADPGVNVLDKDAKYACFTSDGTQRSVFVGVIRKLADALETESNRLQLDVEGKKITG